MRFEKMTLIFVRGKDDKLLSFNANVRNVVLLHHITKVMDAPNVTAIDLMPNVFDAKTAVPLGLCDKMDSYSGGCPGVTNRGTYIALSIREDEDGVKEYTPLLEGDDATKLTTILEARTAEERKKSMASKAKDAKKK